MVEVVKFQVFSTPKLPNCYNAWKLIGDKITVMSDTITAADSVSSGTAMQAEESVTQPPAGTPVEALPTDLRSLVCHQFSLTADTPLEAAQKFFGSRDLEFVAVLEEGRAIGLCARRQIGMALGSRYGFSLFSRSPVRDYLVPQALIIRTTDSIHEVLKSVSSRQDELFYTDVLLIDEDGTFLGSIFVRNLMRLQHSLLLDNLRQLERKQGEIERKNEQMEQELIMAARCNTPCCRRFIPRSRRKPHWNRVCCVSTIATCRRGGCPAISSMCGGCQTGWPPSSFAT
jgi:hypothetical protein